MLDRVIDAIEAEFKAFGYLVTADPILGRDEDFAEALFTGLEKMRQTFAFNAKRYGYRGRSKAALVALHTDLPTPCWGVVVAS